MPYYSDPTLYTPPVGTYSLYLSGPYSNHSSLIAARSSRPNTYVKSLPRFHRGYAPHLSTISETQVNSALRRKYSPNLPLHNTSAKYKVPRPIKINTADIDVSADRYKSRVRASSNIDTSKSKKIESKKEQPRSPSPVKSDDSDNLPIRAIRRDRRTVRLRTLHNKNETDKNENLDSTETKTDDKESVLKDSDSNQSQSKEETKTIGRNPSFHDICTAILQDSIDQELNPGQPESVKRKQSRTFSNEDFFSERRNSAEIPKENVDLLERMLEDEKINKKEDKIGEENDSSREEHKFDSRGSVKRKKKVARKKTNESLVSDDEGKCTLQREAPKKFKRTGTDTSIQSDASEDLEREYQEAIRDISNVEVEEIKITRKPLISATVDVEETVQSKPNLKLIVDDVKVEQVPRTPIKAPKFKFNVIVNVENGDILNELNGVVQNKRKLSKSRISDEDKGKVHIPKAKDIFVSEVRQNHQRASLGDILEDVQKISSKKTEANEKNIVVNGTSTQVNLTLTNSEGITFDSSVHSQDNALAKPDIINEVLIETDPKSTDEKNTLFLNSEINSLNKEIGPLPISEKIEEKPDEMRKKQEYKLSALNNKGKVSVEINNTQDGKRKQDNQNIVSQVLMKNEKGIKKLVQNTSKPEESTKPSSEDVKIAKKTEPTSPEIKHMLPSKQENASAENFWDLIGTRDSVYIQPENVFNKIYAKNSKNSVNDKVITEDIKVSDEQKVKDIVNHVNHDKGNEQILNDDVSEIKTDKCDMQNAKDMDKSIPKKMVSKGSLVNKSATDDPDLSIFIAPPELELEKKPEPESPKTTFVPLQSNRLSQWMHPFKKPEQFDECPVEIFARPKPIKARHYPRPRIPPPPPEPTESDDESEDDSSEEETDESSDTSSDNEGNAEKSTSSIDSGFNSTNGSPAMQRNKGSSETRDSPTSNPAHNPAFALDPGDTLEEYYTSSTYAGFQKSGRITPPATTIPRFRKYSVEDFNFLKVLGKGSFGKVLLAELKDTEYYYAIKCLKKDVVLEDDDVECTLIERKVLALGTKHPYLCHLLCTFQTESHLFFVMEYLNGGDLMFHIQNSGRFPESRARVYGAEIVSGLKFLHSKGIVYRDLKLDNILLDFDGHVRIADFGMCKLQIFLDRTADTFCGTPDYMAPEIIKGLHYNQCVDWWSFGVLLYEMVIGQSPFSGCDEDELFWSICNEKPVLPRFLSSEATSILKQLLEKDANKRLGYKMSPHGEIQDHAFFRSISWDLLEKRQLEAPFKPNLQHPLDTQYFDKTFTIERAKLTPIDKNILQSMDQMQFQGFSYTNPNATDR